MGEYAVVSIKLSIADMLMAINLYHSSKMDCESRMVIQQLALGLVDTPLPM